VSRPASTRVGNTARATLAASTEWWHPLLQVFLLQVFLLQVFLLQVFLLQVEPSMLPRGYSVMRSGPCWRSAADG